MTLDFIILIYLTGYIFSAKCITKKYNSKWNLLSWFNVIAALIMVLNMGFYEDSKKKQKW